jgi:hypothetical protein
MHKDRRILEPPAPKRRKKYRLTITSIIVQATVTVLGLLLQHHQQVAVTLAPTGWIYVPKFHLH